MSEPAKHPLKLFYCYAHEDKEPRNILDSHLSVLKRQKLIEIWYDGKISAGMEWEPETDKHLNSADIVLLSVRTLIAKAEVLNHLKRHEEALTTCEQALQLGKQDSWAYNNKSWALNALLRYEEALVVCEQALQLNSTDACAWNDKSWALNGLGRPEEALMACEESVRLAPDFAPAYASKGWALNGLRRYEEALVAYQQAIDLDLSFASAYHGKSWAFNELKRYEEAEVVAHTNLRSEEQSSSEPTSQSVSGVDPVKIASLNASWYYSLFIDAHFNQQASSPDAAMAQRRNHRRSSVASGHSATLWWQSEHRPSPVDAQYGGALPAAVLHLQHQPHQAAAR